MLQNIYGNDCWNSLLEAGYTDLDEYLNTGSTVGLVYGRPLFSELEE